MAVRGKGRLAQPNASQHDANGIHERHGKNPDCCDGRHRRCLTLGKIYKQPCKHKAQQHAAVVPQKDARTPLGTIAQVVGQKAEHPPHERQTQKHVKRLAANKRHARNKREAHKRD